MLRFALAVAVAVVGTNIIYILVTLGEEWLFATPIGLLLGTALSSAGIAVGVVTFAAVRRLWGPRPLLSCALAIFISSVAHGLLFPRRFFLSCDHAIVIDFFFIMLMAPLVIVNAGVFGYGVGLKS